MKILKPVLPLFLLLFLGNTGFLWAQGSPLAGLPLQIVNPVKDTLSYCSDSVQVAPSIYLANLQIDEAREGLKVSIVNYVPGEDILTFQAVDGLNYFWDAGKGELLIRGVGTDEQYRDAVRKVYYKNVAAVPTLGVRSFSFGLVDADYLPKTDHFYRYVPALDITWKEARDSAARMEYFGLQGYLATILSKEENDFIWTKINGVGWIGASDEEVEGVWRWVTGPEAGTQFWEGNYNGNPVGGRYEYWNHGEPNNLGDEDFAHVNKNPNTLPKSWNDLPNSPNPDNPYYRAQGFVVEFGGMPGDPEVHLSTTAYIRVVKIAFAVLREFEICLGEAQQLNVATSDYFFQWTPLEGVDHPMAANPEVRPATTTTYKAVGKLGSCIDSAEFLVTVHPLPESLLPVDTFYCTGDTLELDPGEHSVYNWSTGETSRKIRVADERDLNVELSNEFGCSVRDTIHVLKSVKPELDYGSMNALTCGSKNQMLQLAYVGKPAARIKLSSLQPGVVIQKPETLTPEIEVPAFGKYDFEMRIDDPYGCEYRDTFQLEFHNQPKALLKMDDASCKGYNLDLSFEGATVEETQFTWFSNDTVFLSGSNLRQLTIPLGFGVKDRTVGLVVDEQGCLADTTIAVKVIPNVSIDVDRYEGCTPLTVKFRAVSTEPSDTYLWDFGDSSFSDRTVVDKEFMNPARTDTVFHTKLTVVSSEGCSNTGPAQSVVVHPIPSVDLSFSEDDCHGLVDTVYYVGSAGAEDTFYWNLANFQAGEIVRDPQTTAGPLVFNRASAPRVEIGLHVVTQYGCKSSEFKKVWKRKPVFRLDIDTTQGCPPLEVSARVVVLDSVDSVDFSYDFGVGSWENGATWDHVFTTPDSRHVLRVSGVSSVTACSDTIESADTIWVFPVPVASFTFSPDEALISDPVLEFSNQSRGATEYIWNFGDSSSVSTAVDPEHQYEKMGIYTVGLEAVNEWGCIDSVNALVTVAFDRLYPPTAFSPNASEVADREFRIYAEGVGDQGYRLLVFNRWGQIVFRSSSMQNGWDGRMKNGEFAPAGVYTWVLEYLDFRGKKHRQQGTVTLVL